MLVWEIWFLFTYLYVYSFAWDNIDRPSYDQSRRIVKGFQVDIKSYPYAVFLHFDKSRPSCCGSSLITVKTVITSAHCLRELQDFNGGIYAYLGASVPLEAKVIRNITKYKIHPKYNPVSAFFDLALATLNREVPMQKSTYKIPVSMRSLKINESLFTAGWGKTRPTIIPDYSDSRHLAVSKQRIVSVPECQEHTGIKISSAFVCSIPIFGYHYRGDMGNGLVTTKPSMALVGVVSFMKGAATLYANVLNQRKWLRETVKELYEKEPIDTDCC